MSYFPFCFVEKSQTFPAISNSPSQIRIFRVQCGKGCPTGVVPARESKSGGTVTEKDEKKGNGLPFFGIDPAGKSPEQIEREWFEQYYRTGIPQLTARAVLVGAFLGVVMSLSTLYVGLKTGVGSCHHRLYSVFLHRHCPEKNRGLQQQPQSPQE